MEAVQEAKKAKESKKDGVLLKELYTLAEGLKIIMQTTQTMPGKVVYAFNKNQDILSRFSKMIVAKEGELLSELTNKNEDGTPKFNVDEKTGMQKPDFIEDGEEKFAAEIEKFGMTVITEPINVHLVDKELLLNLNVNPMYANFFTLIVDKFGK